jgi:hypothetical protein
MATKKPVQTLDLNTDGYLYINGVKTKKYFNTYGGMRIWEPKLHMDNIPVLEALWDKAYGVYVKYRLTTWEKAFQALIAVGGVGHCQPTHKYEGTKGAWWKYKIEDAHPSYGKMKAWGHDWCDRKPKKLLFVKEATDFYNVNMRSDDLANRHMKVRDAFKRAVDDYLREDFPVTLCDVGRLMWVKVNENRYLYQVQCAPKGGYTYWTMIKQDDNIPEVRL